MEERPGRRPLAPVVVVARLRARARRYRHPRPGGRGRANRHCTFAGRAFRCAFANARARHPCSPTPPS
jgi:hypothetical protein